MNRFALLVLAVVLEGCVSVSSLQSARPVREGQWFGFGALGYESMTFLRKSSDEEVEELQDDIEEIKVPIIETGLRYGVMTDLDLGFKYTTPGSLTLDGKYMFFDDGTMAMAAGLGVSHASLEVGSDGDDAKISFLDIHVPLYISYDLSQTSSVYTAPRYISRTISSSDGESSTDGLIGAAFGAYFSWFVAEVGYFTAPGNTESGIMQVMIGYSGGYDMLQRDTQPSKTQRRRKRAG